MRKIFILISVGFFIVLSVPKGHFNSFILNSVADTTDINPNGSSELSALMREMYDHALAARKNIIENKKPGAFPEKFKNIYSAVPTDENTKNKYYDYFADLYLMSLDRLAKSRSSEASENFKNLVSACIACHTTHCPGPMPMIKKLALEK